MLINTAGSGLGGLVADRSAADIARLIALNTPGVTLLAHVAATRTQLWQRAGAEPSSIPPPFMQAADLVDAALAGFDTHEVVTVPALSDAGRWDAFDAAQQAMLPAFANIRPAARYPR